MTRPAIVALGPGDHHVLARLQAECFSDPWGADGMARTASLPGVFGLIARVTAVGKRAAVGFALARIAADEAELLTIGVLPAWRGQGLARRLLDAVLVRAAALGAARVLLEVAEDNAAARALYARRNFEIVGRRPNYYRRSARPAIDALILRWQRSAGDAIEPRADGGKSIGKMKRGHAAARTGETKEIS